MWNDFWELPRSQRLAVGLVCALLIGLIALGGIWQYLFAVRRGPQDGTVVLRVEPNMTGQEIGELLEKEGVVESARMFRLALRLNREERSMKSGTYRLSRGLTVEEAMAELQKGTVAFKTVTFPEGSTVRQMEAILRRAGLAGGEHFLEEAAVYAPLPYMKGPEPAAVAGEGFLFADTYDIPESFTARQICDLMYRRTDAVLDEDVRRRAEEKGLTLHEVVTIASLVEREARFREDQVPIASVILARLDRDMPIQIDASVQYALGETKPELTTADLEVPSPYNTYRRTGLPPGPIAAPGRAAILAVLDAQPGEYLYYVADRDGRHVFERTYEDHLRAIREIYG